MAGKVAKIEGFVYFSSVLIVRMYEQYMVLTFLVSRPNSNCLLAPLLLPPQGIPQYTVAISNKTDIYYSLLTILLFV